MAIKIDENDVQEQRGPSGAKVHPHRKGAFYASAEKAEIVYKKGSEKDLNVHMNVRLLPTIDGDDELGLVQLRTWKGILGVYGPKAAKAGKPRMMEVVHVLMSAGLPREKAVKEVNAACAKHDESKPAGVRGIMDALNKILAAHVRGKKVGVKVAGLEDRPNRGIYACDWSLCEPRFVEEAIKTDSAHVEWTSVESRKMNRGGASSTGDDADTPKIYDGIRVRKLSEIKPERVSWPDLPDDETPEEDFEDLPE